MEVREATLAARRRQAAARSRALDGWEEERASRQAWGNDNAVAVGTRASVSHTGRSAYPVVYDTNADVSDDEDWANGVGSSFDIEVDEAWARYWRDPPSSENQYWTEERLLMLDQGIMSAGGLPTRHIQRLPLVRFERGKHDFEANECAVCLEKFKAGDGLLQLPCKHVFHHECMLPWFRIRSRCPYCRADVRDDADHELEAA